MTCSGVTPASASLPSSGRSSSASPSVRPSRRPPGAGLGQQVVGGGAAQRGRSSAATCSAIGKPPAASRLRRIRPGSGSSPASRSAAQAGGRAGEPEQVGQRLPLGVPGPGGALVLLLRGGDEGGDQPGHLPGAAEDGDGGDRVPLVRHGGRPAAARLPPPPLGDLADLGLREQGDVTGDLAEHPGHARAGAAAISVIRSRSVCHGRVGAARPELHGQQRRDLGPAVAERGQGARGPAELDREPAGRDPVQRGRPPHPARSASPPRPGRR